MEEKIKEANKRLQALKAKQNNYQKKLKDSQKKKKSRPQVDTEPLDLGQYAVENSGIEYLKQNRNIEMSKYFGVLIILIVVGGGIFMGGGIDRAIDSLSFIFVVGIGIGHTLGTKNGESKIKRFGDGCLLGGWLGLLVGITLITGTDFAAQMDFTILMPAISVSLLSLLYGYLIKTITLQLH